MTKAPSNPSFVFGYWRPWKDDADFSDSYLNYVKDKTLVKYGADTIGKFIVQANKQQTRAVVESSKDIVNSIKQNGYNQVQAINALGQELGGGINLLSNQISDVNETLNFLNRNLDVQLEQHKLSNLILQNIAELLKVPDSEKERLHSIELGIKFFVKASKDEELYTDALEELHKAEALMKQDSFVLHRIGCIYMYAEKHLNPQKAFDYFKRAAKYAIVDSDIHSIRLANLLTQNSDVLSSERVKSTTPMEILAAESYEKAAFAAYVIGKFSDAVLLQSKALELKESAQNKFVLAKYLIRNDEIESAITNLEDSIDDFPMLALACFKEIDLINEPQVMSLLRKKNSVLNEKIKSLRNSLINLNSREADKLANHLAELIEKSYETKVAQLSIAQKKEKEIKALVTNIELEIESLIQKVHSSYSLRIDKKTILKALESTKNSTLEEKVNVKSQIQKELNADKDEENRLKIFHSDIIKILNTIDSTSFQDFQNYRMGLLKCKLTDMKNSKSYVNYQLLHEIKKDLQLELEILDIYNTTNENLFSDDHIIALKNALKEIFISSPIERYSIEVKLTEIKKRIESSKLCIGSKFRGGIVFHIDKQRKHGLICSEFDLGYFPFGYGFTKIGATKVGILESDGLENTKLMTKTNGFLFTLYLLLTGESLNLFRHFIGNFLKNKTIRFHSNAAEACIKYKTANEGVWYLPTIKQLNLIYENLYNNNLGNFKKEILNNLIFWSSTETSSRNACILNFKLGSISEKGNKKKFYRVRAIQSF